MNTPLISILQLRKNIESGDFQSAYTDLLLNRNDNFVDRDKVFLLKLAVIFLNYGDYSIAKLGYRIIVRYANAFNDFEPLYDVSINKGYIPVASFIESRHFNSEASAGRFFNQFFAAYNDNFKQDGIFLSHGQKRLVNFSSGRQTSFVLVAPTSYGKSEIIISRILENVGKKICVIVPSKALLAQTKRRLLGNPNLAPLVKRIITHPDMYKGTEKDFVAVLTQERLLRLLQKNATLSIDIILLDEAHNLLKSDTRTTLLTQVLLIVLKRNNGTVLNYFTPFISDSNNLNIPYAPHKLDSQNTTEYIKVEKYYACDLLGDKKLFLYDQFLNKFYRVNGHVYTDEIAFIKKLKADKNIVYLNKPKDIEKVALELSAKNTISVTAEITKLCDSISDFLHPDYNLVSCLKKGLVYHHGGMPDVIRLYVESIFTKVPQIEFIVTSSTLLEGVNIPAEKIFLLSTKIGRGNFSKSEFKNLIGRVCRFSEIFNKHSGSLRMLEPEIYVIKSGYVTSKNIGAFLKKTARVDLNIVDEVDNLLLKTNVQKLSTDDQRKVKDALEYLENIEPDTVKVDDIKYVSSQIGQLCFKNNVYDFDIITAEAQLVRNLRDYGTPPPITTPADLMEAINLVFIHEIDIQDENLTRLANDSARRFYAMILEWRTSGSSYKQMIGKFTSYWASLKDKIIYAGPRWGEITRNADTFRELYIDLADKTDKQKVNLAILRIKEEQDFVDNNLVKYVEILNDLGLIEDTFYEKIKYGSSDKNIICLLKNGFSIDLARCIMDSAYAIFVKIDLESDEVFIEKAIIEGMELNGENPILIFEISYHVS